MHLPIGSIFLPEWIAEILAEAVSVLQIRVLLVDEYIMKSLSGKCHDCPEILKVAFRNIIVHRTFCNLLW